MAWGTALTIGDKVIPPNSSPQQRQRHLIALAKFVEPGIRRKQLDKLQIDFTPLSIRN